MWQIILTLMLFHGQNADKRIISLYARNINNQYYLKQLQLLNAGKAGLTDRDVVIQRLVFSDKTTAIFKANHINSDFTIVLTGKDGKEKYRSTQPVTNKKIYAIIDGMSMRQIEMQHKQSN